MLQSKAVNKILNEYLISHVLKNEYSQKETLVE